MKKDESFIKVIERNEDFLKKAVKSQSNKFVGAKSMRMLNKTNMSTDTSTAFEKNTLPSVRESSMPKLKLNLRNNINGHDTERVTPGESSMEIQKSKIH